MKEKERNAAICFFIAFITCMILFICSFHYVNELEYCLEYNIHTKTMEKHITEAPGTYFLGGKN